MRVCVCACVVRGKESVLLFGKSGNYFTNQKLTVEGSHHPELEHKQLRSRARSCRLVHAPVYALTHITAALVFKLPIILQLQINTMDDLTANTATEKRFHASLLLTPIPIVPGNSACERQPLQKKVNYARIAVFSALPARKSAAVAPDLYGVLSTSAFGKSQELRLCGEAQRRSRTANRG